LKSAQLFPDVELETVVDKLPEDKKGKFCGAVIGAKKNGQGTYLLWNGDVLKGIFVDDKLQEGAFVDHDNGHLYVGKYKSTSSNASQGGGAALTDNLFCGPFEGYIYFMNGEVYTGSFQWIHSESIEGKNELKLYRHGRGISERVDGSTYNGMRSRGKKNGFGVLTHSNGDRLIGNWKDDKHDGTQFDLSSENAKLSGNEAAVILASLKGMQPQPHLRDRVPIFTPFMQMMRLLRSRFSAFRARASIPTMGLCCRSFPL
jgi:hypothetical protein